MRPALHTLTQFDTVPTPAPTQPHPDAQVRHQEVAGGCELDLEQRRQILADILVWAEVTRSQYDSSTAS